MGKVLLWTSNWAGETQLRKEDDFYMGAGTSGRLGILNASECPHLWYKSSRVIGLVPVAVSLYKQLKMLKTPQLLDGMICSNNKLIQMIYLWNRYFRNYPLFCSRSGMPRKRNFNEQYVAVRVSHHPGGRLSRCGGGRPRICYRKFAHEGGTAQKMILNMIWLMIRLGIYRVIKW